MGMGDGVGSAPYGGTVRVNRVIEPACALDYHVLEVKANADGNDQHGRRNTRAAGGSGAAPIVVFRQAVDWFSSAKNQFSTSHFVPEG